MRNLRLSTQRNLEPASSSLLSADASTRRAGFSSMVKHASTFWRLLLYSLRINHLHFSISMCKECLSCHHIQWKCSQCMQWSLWDISAHQLIRVYSILTRLTLPGCPFLESSAERSKIVLEFWPNNPSRIVALNFSRLHKSKYFCQNQHSISTLWSWTEPKVIIP